MTLLEQCRRARESFLGGAHRYGIPSFTWTDWRELFAIAAGSDSAGAELQAFVSRLSPGYESRRARFRRAGLTEEVTTFELSNWFPVWADDEAEPMEIAAVLGKACVMAQSLESEVA